MVSSQEIQPIKGIWKGGGHLKFSSKIMIPVASLLKIVARI